MEPAPTQNPSRRYAVFLSYRHADNKEPGRQWATWLHHLLEGYEVPADLAGGQNSKGEPIPASLYPVFRDEEELPADADLTRNIRQALANSELLVVLCSPRAVESRFVADEIRYFKELGKSNRILALMIDGEPNAADDPGRAKLGIPPETECLPEPLRYGVAGPDGKIDWSQRTEPIAADVRPEGRAEQGWTSGAAYREALQKGGKLRAKAIAQKVHAYEQQLELAKLKVVAGSLGVPLGELTRRDKAMQLDKARQRARALKLWLAAVGVLALLAVAAGGFAWHQKRVAVAQEQRTQTTLARSDYLQAVALVQQAKFSEALPYLARSLRVKPHDNPAASLAFDLMLHRPVLRAVLRSDTNSGTVHSDERARAEYSPDGSEVMLTCGATVQLWNPRTGRAVTPPIPHSSAVIRSLFSPDGSCIATASTGNSSSTNREIIARVWDAKTGAAITPPLAVKYDDVNDFTFSPDGNRLIALSRHNDYTAHAGTGFATSSAAQAWDAQSGQTLSLPFLLDQSIDFIGFSPDGSLAMTSSEGKPLQWWDLKTGLMVRTPPQVSSDNGLVFSPDGSRLLSYSDSAQVWDMKTGRALTARLPLDYSVYSAGFSPDGSRVQIVSGYSDEHSDLISIKAWDAGTGQPWGQPPEDLANVSAATFSPDGTAVATVAGGQARVWDAQTGKAITPPLKHDNLVVTAAFSPEGKRVVTASFDRTARVWDARTGEAITPPLEQADRVRAAVFSPDGTQILATSDDQAAQVWDARAGQPPVSWFEHGINPQEIVFSPDGARELVVSGGNLQVWDVRSGQPFSPPFQHGKSVYSAAFSPDGKRLVTTADDTNAMIWYARSGRAAAPPLPVGKFAGCPVFSPDGTRLFILGDTTDNAGSQFSGRIWDTATGKPIGPPMIFPESVDSAAFSPDGKILTTVTSILVCEVRTWNAQTGQPIGPPLQLGQSKLGFIQVSPDGARVLYSFGDWDAHLIDAQSGQPAVPLLRHHDYVQEGFFSADGSRIATSSANGVIRVWDARTGQPLAPPMTPTDGVHSFTFSRDGSRLAIIGNNSVQVWDCATSQPLTAPLELAAYVIRSVAFSPDGLRLLIETTQNSVRVADLAPAADPPAWFSDLLESAAFSRLNDLGVTEPVPAENLLRAERQRLASTSNNPWEVFGRWLYTDPAARTVTPWSTLTMPDYVQQLISYNQPDTLTHAITLSYGHPDWQARAQSMLQTNWGGYQP